ncbi:hypothetical protein HBA55_36745, partial [Pseudomaricurvus alkylphenolicus]|uniref:Zn-ribbon domain-containing OB-fold protein n=1 Tax=Pseudomaricurvus alkylphenolicus TaxID=1306991 RepID=UPI001F109772
MMSFLKCRPVNFILVRSVSNQLRQLGNVFCLNSPELQQSPQQPSTDAQKTKNKPQSRKALRPRPGINRDNAFFWEGVSQGKLLIQRCTSCQSLRHPLGPMFPQCQSLEWDTVESSGKGEIYSFVNLHHPQVPPFDSPNPIVLVE